MCTLLYAHSTIAFNIHSAKAILNLKLFHDKNVVETVRERTVVEDDPEVQAVLVDILKASS